MSERHAIARLVSSDPDVPDAWGVYDMDGDGKMTLRDAESDRPTKAEKRKANRREWRKNERRGK